MAKETDLSLNLPFVILHRFGPVPIPYGICMPGGGGGDGNSG